MMDEVATIDTGTVLETQSTETESQAPEATETQAAPKAAGSPSLKELLKREKDDPNVKFTDAELDVLDKHYEDPKPKTKAAEPKETEDDEADESAEKPAVKPEKEEKEEAEEPEESEDEPAPEAKAILKELGAKSLKDAAEKLKDLKRLVGGKDAQAVARVTKEKEEIVNGGKALWSALAKGDANAIAFAEKTFGVKFASKGSEQPKPETEGDRFIDPAKFIDPESADMVEAAFKRQAEHIQKLEARFGTIEQERERHIRDTVALQSRGRVVDEMAAIASRIPELKSLPGFREIAQGVLDGKPDSRLDVFTKLFDLAAEEKCTLKQAYEIQRGRDSDRIEAQAIEKGRKEAYNQKPNPSLSGATGGKGEASYQPVTPDLLEKWESDHTTHPAHWYDKDGDILQSKVPKGAWKIFGFK